MTEKLLQFLGVIAVYDSAVECATGTAARRRAGPRIRLMGQERENGVRSLAVQCHQCRHETVMNVDHLPGDLTVPSFGPRMVCTKCGTIGADVRPNWKAREQRR